MECLVNYNHYTIKKKKKKIGLDTLQVIESNAQIIRNNMSEKNNSKKLFFRLIIITPRLKSMLTLSSQSISGPAHFILY